MMIQCKRVYEQAAPEDGYRVLVDRLWPRGVKKADLVLESREKNFIYYELNTSVLEEIMLWISELKGGTSDVEKI